MAFASKILLLSLVAGSVKSLASHQLIRRDLGFDDLHYLARMCYPNYSDPPIDSSNSADYTIASLLHDSPLPCEQVQFIFNGCIANGTTEIDYLAEQQCFCGSNFLDAYRGCIDCSRIHGFSEGAEQTLAQIDTVWTAECKSGPSPGFVSLFDEALPEQPETPTTTLSGDRFPSQTAVSNYWTGAPRAILGSITGSATARQTTHSDFWEGKNTVTTTIWPSSSSSKKANFSYTSNSTSTAASSVSSPATTLAPISSTPVTPLSQASTSAPSSTSTNGAGLEMGMVRNSGMVLVIVNLAVVALL
ncbi:hypothetical protein VTL71DRAFT_14889 [Oculimacula yallundae]|uniref:Uncharacterized protein n=1 Tax=Oculimacula yallundae TaxID=86028 RepID=A0ABR4CG99_9HELO